TAAERLAGYENLTFITADMEDGPDIFSENGALTGQQFDGIVVVNYLHRPLFPGLLSALKPNGIFIYETFARDNEKYARPRNPDHLLEAGELLECIAGRLQVIAYEHGMVNACSGIGVKQRIAAINSTEPCKLEDLNI
ncbi:MAG: SAM-dependent methyltransferase, partial [Rhodospirillales bacterium]|nr:SAM-dependent methyltransferase [Rhodospirillales bacterium]